MIITTPELLDDASGEEAKGESSGGLEEPRRLGAGFYPSGRLLSLLFNHPYYPHQLGAPGGRGAASMPLLQRSPHSSPHGSPTSSRRPLGIDSTKPGSRMGAGGFILGAVWALLVFGLLTSSPVARLQRGEAILGGCADVKALSSARVGAARAVHLPQLLLLRKAAGTGGRAHPALPYAPPGLAPLSTCSRCK